MMVGRPGGTGEGPLPVKPVDRKSRRRVEKVVDSPFFFSRRLCVAARSEQETMRALAVDRKVVGRLPESWG